MTDTPGAPEGEGRESCSVPRHPLTTHTNALSPDPVRRELREAAREEAAAVLMRRWGCEDDDQDAYDAACADFDALLDAGLVEVRAAALPAAPGTEMTPGQHFDAFAAAAGASEPLDIVFEDDDDTAAPGIEGPGEGREDELRAVVEQVCAAFPEGSPLAQPGSPVGQVVGILRAALSPRPTGEPDQPAHGRDEAGR